MIYMLTEIG